MSSHVWKSLEKRVRCCWNNMMKKWGNGFLSFLFLSPFLFLCFCCSTFCERSSLCTPPTLCPSVPLLCALPLFFPLHAVVCRHAGISGPQNDRPNLSALAPVTKDGRLCSVCAYDWCTSELLPTWLVITCLSTALVLLAKAWILYFCLYRTQFQTVSICNLWLLSDYNSSCLLLSLLHSFVCGCRSICVIACSCLCLLVCEWGVCRLAQLSIQLR